jgi:hypothetical protein
MAKYELYCEGMHVGYVTETSTDMYRESGKFTMREDLISSDAAGKLLYDWISKVSILNEIDDTIEDGDVEGEKRYDHVFDEVEKFPKYEEKEWTLIEVEERKIDKIDCIRFSYGCVAYYLKIQ